MNEYHYKYYLALVAGIVFVAMQHKEKTLPIRAVIAGISGALGHALSGDVALMVGRSEVVAVALITPFVYVALDTVLAIVADRDAMWAFVKARLGGGK